MTNLTDLETRIQSIEQRNARVTADKAWETSVVRRTSIGALTYIVVVVYLTLIHNSNPWINAIVPVMGYLLSTLVLAKVKAAWVKRFAKNS